MNIIAYSSTWFPSFPVPDSFKYPEADRVTALLLAMFNVPDSEEEGTVAAQEVQPHRPKILNL